MKPFILKSTEPRKSCTCGTMTQTMKVAAAFILALIAIIPQCLSQGTMTFTFNGQPPGTIGSTEGYIESGMTFSTPYGPQAILTVGTGVSGHPDDGTGCLALSSTALLAFSYNTFPGTYFNLVSFDAAGFSVSFPGPVSLEVVGYKGMFGTVTNYFTVDSLLNRRANSLPDFQTFYLGSQFQQVSRVDVLTDLWSLDNVVISGVPEPSTGALLAVGAFLGVGYRRGRRRQPGD